MTRLESEIASFRAAVSETADLWPAIDVRVLAVRIGGVWHSLALRCTLDPRSPDEIPRLAHLPELQSVAAWQDVWPASALDVVLDGLRAGTLEVGGHTVELRRIASTTHADGSDVPVFGEQPYESATAAVAVRLPTKSFVSPDGERGHWLRAEPGGALRSLPRFIDGGERAADATLRALEHPWNGLEGLARAGVRSTLDLNGGGSPRAEVIAVLGAAFAPDSVRVTDGTVHAIVRATSKATAMRCTVGFIAEYEDGTVENGTLSLAKRWRGRSTREARVGLAVGREATRVTLLLRIGPHVVDQQETTVPTARTPSAHVAAYAAVDPGLSTLRKALAMHEAGVKEDSQKGQREFEHAVARLLSLAGLAADALDGYDGLRDSFDVLARTPGGDIVFAVECTLGAIMTKRGKPTQLLSRAARLRQAPGLSGVEVVPVFVTSRPRALLAQGDLEVVAHDEMVVLAFDDLTAITNMLEAGATTGDIVRFIRQKIPVSAAAAERAWDTVRGRRR